jgi:hypothetical protein
LGDVFGRRDRGFEREVTLGSVAGDEFVDPRSGEPVGGGDFGGSAAFDDDGGDDQAGFRHPTSV